MTPIEMLLNFLHSAGFQQNEDSIRYGIKKFDYTYIEHGGETEIIIGHCGCLSTQNLILTFDDRGELLDYEFDE